MLAIERERAEIDVKKLNAQANYERATKWNGKEAFSDVTIQGATAIVDKDGQVKTLNIAK